MAENALGPWYLRREINVSLVIALLAQVAAAAWWISDFNAWRNQARDHLIEIDQELEASQRRAAGVDRELADRLGRIETMLANIEKRLDDRRKK